MYAKNQRRCLESIWIIRTVMGSWHVYNYYSYATCLCYIALNKYFKNWHNLCLLEALHHIYMKNKLNLLGNHG